MNVKIPSGWTEIPIGQKVEFCDLQWNRKTKTWEPVTKFGDYGKNNKRRYIIRNIENRNQELPTLLRNFPNYFNWKRNFNIGNKAFLFAHIMFLAGVKEMKHSVMYSCGKKEIINLQVNTNSIVVKPYVSHPIAYHEYSGGYDSLFYFLLKKLGIRYSGGASKENGGFTQASMHDDLCDKSLDKDFFAKIVCYFNAIKQEFGT